MSGSSAARMYTHFAYLPACLPTLHHTTHTTHDTHGDTQGQSSALHAQLHTKDVGITHGCHVCSAVGLDMQRR